MDETSERKYLIKKINPNSVVERNSLVIANILTTYPNETILKQFKRSVCRDRLLVRFSLEKITSVSEINFKNSS